MLLADVVSSRRIDDFRAGRDRLLRRLSKEHLDRELVLVPYTVTSYDEFQTIVEDAWQLPNLVWELRREFRPWELKIGLGLGQVDALPGPAEAVNEVSTGEAFLRARAAMDELARPKAKYRILTRVRSGEGATDAMLDLIYDLLDSLLDGVTDRQWETIRTQEQTGRLAATAERLGIDESTVSRNLQRGAYWQIVDARRKLEEFLRLYAGVQNRGLVRSKAG